MLRFLITWCNSTGYSMVAFPDLTTSKFLYELSSVRSEVRKVLRRKGLWRDRSCYMYTSVWGLRRGTRHESQIVIIITPKTQRNLCISFSSDAIGVFIDITMMHVHVHLTMWICFKKNNPNCQFTEYTMQYFTDLDSRMFSTELSMMRSNLRNRLRRKGFIFWSFWIFLPLSPSRPCILFQPTLLVFRQLYNFTTIFLFSLLFHS